MFLPNQCIICSYTREIKSRGDNFSLKKWKCPNQIGPLNSTMSLLFKMNAQLSVSTLNYSSKKRSSDEKRFVYLIMNTICIYLMVNACKAELFFFLVWWSGKWDMSIASNFCVQNTHKWFMIYKNKFVLSHCNYSANYNKYQQNAIALCESTKQEMNVYYCNWWWWWCCFRFDTVLPCNIRNSFHHALIVFRFILISTFGEKP